MSGRAKLLVSCTNQYGLFTVNKLRLIDPSRYELQSTDGCLLFCCFADFRLQPMMLAKALGKPQSQKILPKVVNLNSPEPPTFVSRSPRGSQKR